MKELTLIEAKEKFDLLEGCKNRIYVTDDLEELYENILNVDKLLLDIYNYNLFRLTRTQHWNATQPVAELYECNDESMGEDFMMYTKKMFSAINIVNLAELMVVCDNLLNKLCKQNMIRLASRNIKLSSTGKTEFFN